MPGLLTFDADHVRDLIAASRASTARRATFAELATMPELWRDDMPAERRALLMSEIEADGMAISANEADVDPAMVEPSIWLVGDRGIYLMSNAPIDEVKAIREDHVAYALECDPTKMDFDQWWEAKGRIYGGSDGGESVSVVALEQALAVGGPLRINLREDAIEFVVEAPNAEPTPGL